MIECIDRAKMPQIDEADLPELLVFLGSRGVGLAAGIISPWTFTSHQAINRDKVEAMPLTLLHKPILTSGDWGILDGNHRWAKHRAVGSDVPYLQVLTSFDDALTHLYSFPKTYEYGDDQFHPIKD